METGTQAAAYVTVSARNGVYSRRSQHRVKVAKMLHEVTVRVKSLRYLPQQFFQEEKERESALSRATNSSSGCVKSGSGHRRCLKAQASIVEDIRETGNSVWGKGVRSREAMWLKGADTLSWRLDEAQFKQVKAYTPLCKVHVYATDATAPKMETSHSVGWFTVDMRDLAGQRLRDERWVKLQGASPAEVLISSTLSMVREQDQAEITRSDSRKARETGGPVTDKGAILSAREKDNRVGDVPVDGGASASAPPASLPQRSRSAEKPDNNVSVDSILAGAVSGDAQALSNVFADSNVRTDDHWGVGEPVKRPQHPRGTLSADDEVLPVTAGTGSKSSMVLTLPAAEAVSELDALPIGPDANDLNARIFSLSISVKGAARLLQLAPAQLPQNMGMAEGSEGFAGAKAEAGLGFWFSYSVFGVVVQTDRFDQLADPSPGDGPVLQPMLDSFRLRATLPGLCHFLSEAPPLQVYLCTERRILAHADVDMSRLLPRDQWEGRTASEFGRTGMEGDFELRRPGEPLGDNLSGKDPSRDERSGSSTKAVVTICAQLTRADLTSGDGSSVWSDGVSIDSGLSGAAAAADIGRGEGVRSGGRVDRGAAVRTWTREAPVDPSGAADRGGLSITVTLQRLELRPSASRMGNTSDLDSMNDAASLGTGVLVGIQGVDGGTLTAGDGEGIGGGCRLVGCGEQGEVEIEDGSLLDGIEWSWVGTPPQAETGLGIFEHEHEGGADGRRHGASAPLAYVRVMQARPGQRRNDVIAVGAVPWPSPARVTLEQRVSVTLVSPPRETKPGSENEAEGEEVGSCWVCVRITHAVENRDVRDIAHKGTAERRHSPRHNHAVQQQREGSSPVFSQSFVSEESEKGKRYEDEVKTSRVESNSAAISAKEHGDEERSKSKEPLQAEEAVPAESKQDGVGVDGRAPRSYRLSINLASVKDLDNAAYVVACYNYPHFGTSAPVRTSLVWVPPRTETPLANACCAFSFEMSCDRLNNTVRDRPLVVSIRSKDRFKEEEMGLVTLPLQDLTQSPPRYFRCRDTNKTFTSIGGFRAHLKSRQRADEMTSADAANATPVEVKVVDMYLTVASTAPLPGTAGRARLCSLRVILLLEDMGPTGMPNDEDEDAYLSAETPAPASRPMQCFAQQKLPSFVPSTVLTGLASPGELPPSLEAIVHDGVQGRADLERAWAEWERWRVREEAAFATRLREKDQALEEKWAARESARRRDVQQAQQDYAKLEVKLRKALSEVEARERSLKAREDGWRADHAQKLSELQLLQRRLREETKHQVDLERMKVKALERQVEIHAKGLEDARARMIAADDAFEQFRQQSRKTPEGRLRQEVFRLGAAKAEAEAQVERERSEKHKALLEKEEYRAHIHKLARALKRHQERESTCARREMEQLRLEYLAREERFMLDGDRNELRSIKQELDQLRHLSLVQEAAGLSGKPNPTAAATPATVPTTPSSRVQSGRPLAGAPQTSAVHASPTYHDAGSLLELPGPSPSPPPHPTPAPVPANLSHRWDRGVSVSSEVPGLGVRLASGVGVVPKMADGDLSMRSNVEHVGQETAARDTPAFAEARVSHGGNLGFAFPTVGDGEYSHDDKRRDKAGFVGVRQGVTVSDMDKSQDGEVEELQRLVDWRSELLATGMYTADNPIVTELSRRIASASGDGDGWQEVLQREE